MYSHYYPFGFHHMYAETPMEPNLTRPIERLKTPYKGLDLYLKSYALSAVTANTLPPGGIFDKTHHASRCRRSPFGVDGSPLPLVEEIVENLYKKSHGTYQFQSSLERIPVWVDEHSAVDPGDEPKELPLKFQVLIRLSTRFVVHVCRIAPDHGI